MTLKAQTGTTESGSKNFIRDIIDKDLADGRHTNIITRFPPEPNGYLHIGHAKSIVLNFGIAKDYDGQCNLRFDDTNPETEDMEYIESIKDAVHWLGYDWDDHIYYASDYFEQFYQYATKLIKDGKAYVDSLNENEISEYRGSVNEPGKPSPHRNRTIEENIQLFENMRAGRYKNGEHVLRAKIDMSSPHMIMRDPLLYRIKHAHHYRQGDDWCIYPMYDFAHPLEDAIEDVTHSICTLEFDTNRVLYDWVLDNCLEPEELPTRPHQYEFARLNLTYTVMSKRKLRRLIEEGRIAGWDDPRMPSLVGMRRRGIPAEAIREFCKEIGVTRTESTVEMSHFEHILRDDLNYRSPRVNAVIEPLKVVVTNFPEGETDWIEGSYWPRDIDKDESREIPFTRELYIDRDDFREKPPGDFFRLSPGAEVRLRYGYFITCDEMVKDDEGNVVELHCSYDPATRGGDAPDGRNPAGTIHWVSADHAVPAEIRRYNRLFNVPEPEADDADFADHLNPDSLIVSMGFVEPSVTNDPADTRYQFERVGYFWQDPEDSTPENLVFNQIVPLRDTWAEEEEETESQAEIERKRKQREREKELQRARSSAGEKDPFEDLQGEQLERAKQYTNTHQLNQEDAAVLAREDEIAEYYERVLTDYDKPQAVAKYVLNDLMRVRKDIPIKDLPFNPWEFARFVSMVDQDVISSRAADEVFETMVAEGGNPELIVDRKGLRQIESEEDLSHIIEDVLAENPDKVEEYRQGKQALMGFFMGQVMKKTSGAANPELSRELLQKLLAE